MSQILFKTLVGITSKFTSNFKLKIKHNGCKGDIILHYKMGNDNLTIFENYKCIESKYSRISVTRLRFTRGIG